MPERTKTENQQDLWTVEHLLLTKLKYELSNIRGLEVQAPSNADLSLWHLPCRKQKNGSAVRRIDDD